ncbi:MAG: hypothetical protein JXR20_12845 [Balneola sp.]
MKSTAFISFLLLFPISFIGNLFAQGWEPPFEFEANYLSTTLPDEKIFNNFDSALVILKVQFDEIEDRINWFDIVRVDLFKKDSVAYHFFNTDINPDWGANSKKTKIEVYPDSITLSLVQYLEKIKSVEFEPTKYAEKYRLVPVYIPVRLNSQSKPAY